MSKTRTSLRRKFATARYGWFSTTSGIIPRDGQRVAFAFDPVRQAILLISGNKSGVAQKRFYKSLIATADKRFDEHLTALAMQET